MIEAVFLRGVSRTPLVSLTGYRCISSRLRAAAMGEVQERYKAEGHSCLVLGYTGETGKALVRELESSRLFSKVILIGRRQVQLDLPADFNVEQRVVDFEKLEESAQAFSGADVGFSCLGTTRGKAGADGFVKVDYDYVVNSAKMALDQGCSHFHLVSSQGADANSSLLYTKTKGRAEEAIKAMTFNRVSVYRPGLLLCDREERRTGEACFRALFRPIAALFPTAGSVPTTLLARAMLHNCLVSNPQPRETLDNKTIHQLAKSPDRKQVSIATSAQK